MITVRIRLNKAEIKSLSEGFVFLIKRIKPADVHDLGNLETLAGIYRKLRDKACAQKEKQTLALSAAEASMLVDFGETVYSKIGGYESAAWHRVGEEIRVKVEREIQIRMT
jgi:hypothetical protein